MPAPQGPQALTVLDDAEQRQEMLESIWRGWRPGLPLPRWEDFLPPPGQPCAAGSVCVLLQMDVEFRVKAGVPALLAEPYFQHERLQAAGSLPDAAQQQGLIRWEYQQRWKRGERAPRRAYLERFPEHAAALHDLAPRWNCPRCKEKGLPLDEAEESADCPRCGARLPLAEVFPPPGDASGLDLREYQLMDRLGGGGMGEVYLSRDPGLDRPLALKVLRPDWHGHRELERRFEEEARITGSLQHPSIVPVYNIGRLRDGRLYFTMKVVRGSTFAELLAEQGGEEGPAAHLGVFLQVCQAVAYAHSKGVIHRDLKPENVMVGRFGEVQVMDWGLAKVLGKRGDARREQGGGGSELATRPRDRAGGETVGAVGTPAYMAPEQANGEWDRADERVDVFGLGGILCAILTGRPPYRGSGGEVLRKAQRGDLAETFARLDDCGADAVLLELAKECLAAEMDGRPRDAGAVAGRMAAYLAAVQERLRVAEVGRAAAQARAEEAVKKAAAERRARRLLLGLAAAVLLLLLGGGAGAWTVQQQRARQARAEQEALAVVEQRGGLLDEGWEEHDLAKLTAAKAEADRAVGIARSGNASDAVLKQIDDFKDRAEDRLQRARSNNTLRGALVDVAAPRETSTYENAEGGRMVATAQPSADEQYAAAFRRWGKLDLDQTAEAEVVARLRREPEVVFRDVAAALDSWMVERRRQNHPEAKWRRLFRVAQGLDENTQSRQLRELLVGGSPPRPDSVAGLVGQAGASLPWPGLWDVARGNTWRRLRTIRGGMGPGRGSVFTVVLYARACSDIGDVGVAEQVLREALAVRPDEILLLDALGKLLEDQRPARLGEAIECYRAIRARRAHLGVRLGTALVRAGRAEEGEAVLRDLVRQQPANTEMRFYLGNALYARKKHGAAAVAFREAIRLKRDYPHAHNNLGGALIGQRKYEKAETAYHEAIRLKHDYPNAHNNLGLALDGQGKDKEAEAAFRKAIRLKHDFPEAHHNLGLALGGRGKHKDAEAACREAIRLKHDFPEAHHNLGVALIGQRKDKAAEAAFREAIRLKYDLPEAHSSLGGALSDQGKHKDAEAACREAIRLKHDLPEAHYNLGLALIGQGKHEEAEAAFREALRLKHDFPLAHSGLGFILRSQGKHEEAEAAFRKALRLKHDFPEAHSSLGGALLGQGKPNEAEAAFRKALRLKHDLPEAHTGLGFALRAQGRFAEALESFRGGQKLGRGRPGWPDPSGKLVGQCERLVELDGKLPAVANGKAEPANAAEGLELAALCRHPARRLHATAARLAAAAFAANAKLADDLRQQHRYKAAGSAALAAVGLAKDTERLPDAARKKLRQQALAWLRADLALYVKLANSADPRVKAVVQQRLEHWRQDADFAAVRDKEAVASLPEGEREEWRKLWADVATLLERVGDR